MWGHMLELVSFADQVYTIQAPAHYTQSSSTYYILYYLLHGPRNWTSAGVWQCPFTPPPPPRFGSLVPQNNYLKLALLMLILQD